MVVVEAEVVVVLLLGMVVWCLCNIIQRPQQPSRW